MTIPDQTAEDFEQFAPETQFCEYFDGTIYMPSPVSDRHQEIVGFLFVLIDGYRWARDPSWKVLLGPAVLRLNDAWKPEPDLFVVPPNRDETPALLVIEVVSPSHRSYDLDFKAGHYRAGHLPEIWYIDDATRTFYRDVPDADGYRREAIRDGRVAASSLPGFWLDVTWLWSHPLPNPRTCVDTILAGSPA